MFFILSVIGYVTFNIHYVDDFNLKKLFVLQIIMNGRFNNQDR